MTSPVAIALVTDTHTWPTAAPVDGSEGSSMLVNHAETLLDLLLEQVSASGVDMAIHLGDMTNGGGYFNMPGEAFAPQLEMLQRRWRGLSIPVHALPGNHDCPPGGAGLDEAVAAPGTLNGQLSSAWRTFESMWDLPRGQGRTIELESALLLLVNAQGHSAEQVVRELPNDPVYGWLSDAELERVEEAIDGAGDRPVVLLMHQLLRPWAAQRAWQEFYAIQNGDALLALMEKFGNVRAVFQGHAHFYEVQAVTVAGRSVPFVVAPSLVESPLGWLRLVLDARGLSVALQRLPALLPLPSSQAWRAGHDDWANWRLDW